MVVREQVRLLALSIGKQLQIKIEHHTSNYQMTKVSYDEFHYSFLQAEIFNLRAMLIIKVTIISLWTTLQVRVVLKTPSIWKRAIS